MINYNDISKIYDDVRKAGIDLINRFLMEMTLKKSRQILDIGCGTGNYDGELHKGAEQWQAETEPGPIKARQAGLTLLWLHKPNGEKACGLIGSS